MIDAIALSSWEEFEAQLKELRQRYELPRHSPFLFRGQSDSKHHLDTTLDRIGVGPISLDDYYRIVSMVKPEIEAYTGRVWSFPDMKEIEDHIAGYDKVSFGVLPGYEFLAHLRHHGFPSPLLDWSRSPYVAAYFACRSFRWSNPTDTRFSIYVFCERPARVKVGSSSEAKILTFGPVVSTHHRHFRQQSEYSACLVFDKDRGWHFAHHETVAVSYHPEATQDVVWKFDIPCSECPKILKSLSEHNLNAYTLFGTEESLAESLAVREFILMRDRAH